MKKVLNTVLLLLITGVAIAQPPKSRREGHEGRGHGEGRERIHAAKMAYIIDRLRLNVDQAAAFTPVYNEMQQEVRETRKSFKGRLKDGDKERDEADSKQWIDDNLDYQQKIIDIKRTYSDRYLKIISAQQLTELYKAEREFNHMLMQRLRQQRGGGGRFNRMDR